MQSVEGLRGLEGGGVASAGEEVGRVGMVESQEWRALEATVEIFKLQRETLIKHKKSGTLGIWPEQIYHCEELKSGKVIAL